MSQLLRTWRNHSVPKYKCVYEIQKPLVDTGLDLETGRVLFIVSLQLIEWPLQQELVEIMSQYKHDRLVHEYR